MRGTKSGFTHNDVPQSMRKTRKNDLVVRSWNLQHCGIDNVLTKQQWGKMNSESEIHTPLPAGCDPILRLVPMPTDTNYAGDVFGGWIMAQVDIAGSLPAIRRARGRVATVAVNSFVFKQPVFVGDVVSFYADIIKVGRTSITVDVAVYAQRGLRQGSDEICIKVTEAVLTYVAVDENRRPRIVPPE
jgi:acyl-CoA thioesterase YciA